MNILLVLGHLRAGKTTLIQALSHVLASSRHFDNSEVVLVQNDVSFSDGMANLNPFVRHIGMSAGCFGCKDTSKLIGKLNELNDAGCKLCILEPFGFVSGEEMLATLLKSHLPFKIITLVSGGFLQEPGVRVEIVRSQLCVADVMVVTHQDLTPEAATAIGEEIPEEHLKFRLGNEGDVERLLKVVLAETYATSSAKSLEADLGHEHPFTEVIFLPQSFSRDELVSRLAHLPPKGLLRLKGSLGGYSFQADPRYPGELSWKAQSNPQPNVIVIYGSEGYELPKEVAWLRGAVTRSQIRESGERSPEELNAELSQLLDALDKEWSDEAIPPHDSRGRLVVYTEPSEWANDLRKNPHVDKSLKQRAIEQRVRIALMGIVQADHSPHLFEESDPSCESLVHYAVTVCWFHATHASEGWLHPLGQEDVDAIARMLVKGLPHLHLGSDASVSSIILSELAITVDFLIARCGPSEQANLIKAYETFSSREACTA